MSSAIDMDLTLIIVGAIKRLLVVDMTFEGIMARRTTDGMMFLLLLLFGIINILIL